jgi:hypothetical protein
MCLFSAACAAVNNRSANRFALSDFSVACAACAGRRDVLALLSCLFGSERRSRDGALRQGFLSCLCGSELGVAWWVGVATFLSCPYGSERTEVVAVEDPFPAFASAKKTAFLIACAGKSFNENEPKSKLGLEMS